MCAQRVSHTTETLPSKAAPLISYLRGRLHDDGSFYVKSRFIAEEIDLSSKEIGSYMQKLHAAPVEFHVEAWAYTNGTTWYVSQE